jgi:hypothetical protein
MALQEIDNVSENDGMSECIDNCFEAAQASEWCATECIRMGDEVMARCIELCRDVADVTTLHARMMARDSDYSSDLAATCADLCEECAHECAQHDEEHCQVCAETLRACADSCRDMASVGQ